MLSDFDRKILQAIAEAGGQLDTRQLKSLYKRRGDGICHSAMIRGGLTEWVRRDTPTSPAVAVKITERGLYELQRVCS